MTLTKVPNKDTNLDNKARRYNLSKFGAAAIFFLAAAMVMFILNWKFLKSQYFLWLGGKHLAIAEHSIANDHRSFYACADSLFGSVTDNQELALAVENLQTSTKLDLHNSRAYYLLGKAYCFIKQPDLAVDALTQVQTLKSNDLLGAIELGFAYIAQKKKNDQQIVPENEQELSLAYEAAAVKAWRAGGLSSSDFYNAGLQSLKAGRAYEAVFWFENAAIMGTDNMNFFITYSQGRSAEALQEWQEALDLYTRAIEADFSSHNPISSAYYRSGIIYQDFLKKLDLALDMYNQALEKPVFFSENEEIDIYYRMGIIYNILGQKTQAIEVWEQALRLNNGHYGTLTYLGWAFWEANGDFDEAETTLQKAVAVNPSGVPAYRILGDLYRLNNMSERARSMYLTALELNLTDTLSLKGIAALDSTPVP